MKPTLLLYNPPATLNVANWNKPMPLNIMSICSLLPEDKYDISIIQKLPEEAFKELFPKIKNAICLAISCMTGTQIENGLNLALKIKNINPEIKIIWGGYHPTASPKQTLQHELVDVVIQDYGEIVFPQLVERIAEKKSYHDINGISFLKNNEVISNPVGKIPKLDDLPMMPYHLFDVEQFFKEIGSRTLHYTSSRGCPHKCGFCADFVIYKRRWNALSSKKVVSELAFLKKKYNFDKVRFYDSNLFVSEQRIKEICGGLLEQNIIFEWERCNADAFIITRYSSETLNLMKRAGISNVLIGAESWYEPALRCIEKMADVNKNIQAASILHQHGISIDNSVN